MTAQKVAIMNVASRTPVMTHENIWAASAILKDCGYDVFHFPEQPTPELRAAQLHEIMNDSRFSFTWLARGGDLTIEVMPHLDLTRFNPRNHLVGSSDITHMALPLASRGHKILYGKSAYYLNDVPKDQLSQMLSRLDKPGNNQHLQFVSIANDYQLPATLIGGTTLIMLGMRGLFGTGDWEGMDLFTEYHYKSSEDRDDILYWLQILKLQARQQMVRSLLIGQLAYYTDGLMASVAEQVVLAQEVFADCDIPVAICTPTHSDQLVWLG